MSDPLRPTISKLGRPSADGGVLDEIQSEISTEATPLVTFVTNNIKTIVGLVALLLCGIILATFWQWYSAHSVREAQLDLGRILAQPEGADRIAALETFLKSAPETLKTGIHLEIATDALEIQDRSRASAEYGAVYAADPKGTLGLMAAVNQADLLLYENKPVDALKVLDDLLKTAPEAFQKITLQSIRETQGIAAEQAGQLDRALASYKSIVQDGSPNSDMGYYQSKIARLQTQSTKNDGK